MLSEQEYREGLVVAHLVAKTIAQLPLEEMLALIDRCEAIGPMIDPTAFMKGAKRMGEDKEIIEALARAKKRIIKLRAQRRAPHVDEKLQRDVDALLGIRKPYSVDLNDAPLTEQEGDASRVVFGQVVV
jgi:hypothetical protein